jgi:hypothetical protein
MPYVDIPTSDNIAAVLAAAEPLASLYRSVNTCPQLDDSIIEGSPEGLSKAELDQGAVRFAGQPGEGNFGLVDQIATRILAAGGRVIGARKAGIPREQPAARGGSALRRLVLSVLPARPTGPLV